MIKIKKKITKYHKVLLKVLLEDSSNREIDIGKNHSLLQVFKIVIISQRNLVKVLIKMFSDL